LTGRGLPPSKLETVEIAAAVGETNSIQISFKNPFREQISVNVDFEGSTAL